MAVAKDQRASKEAEKRDDGLIAMTKNGDELRVHPSCIKAHQAAGWALV